MKIFAPVKGINGVYASVRFVDGVGETDNPHLIEWFKNHGYKVGRNQIEAKEETKPVVKPEPKAVETPVDAPNFAAMTIAEMRAYAIENGKSAGTAKFTTREQWIKHLTK